MRPEKICQTSEKEKCEEYLNSKQPVKKQKSIQEKYTSLISLIYIPVDRRQQRRIIKSIHTIAVDVIV